MKIKKELEEQFVDFKNKNNDFYGKGIIDFVIRWADLLETKENLTYGIAEGCANEADTEGVTGAMYGLAKSILFTYWYKGKELEEIYLKEKEEEKKRFQEWRAKNRGVKKC